MIAMTEPQPSVDRWAWLREHWLVVVGTIALPIVFFIGTLVGNVMTADHVREQSVRDGVVAQMQSSGRNLDQSIARYFDAIAEAGMLKRGVSDDQMPSDLTASQAQQRLRATRSETMEAFRTHASDVQAMRGFVPQASLDGYTATLRSVRQMLMREPDVTSTGANITTLGKLVSERNKLVDEARKS